MLKVKISMKYDYLILTFKLRTNLDGWGVIRVVDMFFLRFKSGKQRSCGKLPGESAGMATTMV